MRFFILILILFVQLLFSSHLTAQTNFGKISFERAYVQQIDHSSYHQYELNLKKGEIIILDLTDFDIAVELTAVSPEGVVVEQVNNAETTDFLIFEATSKGTYQFYINIFFPDDTNGKYTLTAYKIPKKKDGKLGQIKKLIELLEDPQRVGVAISIIENNKTVFEHYAGHSNIEHGININDKTVFEMASVSKQFTGFAIATLAEQGKLSMEDDIRKYFPELPVYENTILIKHLVNHTAGIIDSDYPLSLAGFEEDPIEIERVLNFLQNTPEQYFETGSEFSYCNDCYTLLGQLVERTTQQSFKEWMQENIFVPLGMNSTSIRDSREIVIPNRAYSYRFDPENSDVRLLNFDFLAPGGCSVRSSLEDMTKWVNYLNKGYHSQESLFNRLNQLDTFNNGDSTSYAYGSYITDFRGLTRFSHLGLAAGFTTAVARFPEKNTSFIFLGNDGEFTNYYLARKIYEIYLEEQLPKKTEIFEGIVVAESNQEEPKTTKPSLKDINLSDYEGAYYSQQTNATYTLELRQDTLYALFAAYAPIPIIEGSKDTLYTDEDFMVSVVFRRDYEGEISECKIYNDSDDHSISFTKIPFNKKWHVDNYWKSNVYHISLNDTLETIKASKIIPGFAVSIFDESETYFQKGYGYANIENNVAYSPETIQLIASISKTFTGVAVMKAMEMGYFQLDDAINDYLPFEIINPKFPDTEITIRHLLTHTSSLNEGTEYAHGYAFEKPLQKNNWPEPHHENLSYYNNNENSSLKAFIDHIFMPNGKWYHGGEIFIEEEPGTSFKYSNCGFALLGYIIESTTKVNFPDFTKKHILDPLGMENSTWHLESVNPKHHTTYYLENYNSCPRYSVVSMPDGGLFTNVIDLTKFLQEAMLGYQGKGSLLSQSSYREMFKSQSELFEIEGGLGWDLGISCCVGHAGNDFGVSTVMYFQPSTGIGRIVLANISAEKEEISNAFYGIMNLLFLEDL